MTTHTADLSGAAGPLSTGYTSAFDGFAQRDGAGAATGVVGEERLSLRTAESYGANQKVTFRRLVVNGATPAMALRGSVSGTFSGYLAQVSSVSNWSIYRVDAGSYVLLTSGNTGTDHAVNDSFEGGINGTVITLKRNTVTIGSYDTASDGTKYSTGSPGLYTFSAPSIDSLVFEDDGGGGGGSGAFFVNVLMREAIERAKRAARGHGKWVPSRGGVLVPA